MTDQQKTQDNNPKQNLPFFGLPKLYPYIKQYTPKFFLMIFLMTTLACADLFIPLLSSYAINHFIEGQTLDTFPTFIIILSAVVLFQSLSPFVWARIPWSLEMYISRDLKRIAFNHLQTLSFSYYNTNSVGYIHSRIMSDTTRISGTIAWGISDITWSLFYLIGMTVVLFTLNWKLALIVVTVIPAATLVGGLMRKKLLEANRAVREINSRITGSINEGITGAKTIKTLVVEEKMEQEFFAVTGQMQKSAIHVARLSGALISIVVFFCYAAIAAILGAGGKMASNDLLLVGTLSVFTSYAIGMVDPIQNIARILTDLVNAKVNIERLTSLIETEPNVKDSPEVIEKYGDNFSPKKENWEEIEGEIEFCDVSFTYPDGDEPVLEHFNLKIPAHTKVAIVGETGAGKSTLVNLACRFFEPTSGVIKIDGRDYRERSQLWLHSNLGYVLQTPHLFSGTVLENLRYGNPNATMEQVKEAVRSVSAEYIIDRLDKGYDSEVGEGGSLLSTGEKQLLSFARAVLASPAIFVLDEATSSVDTMTEKLIEEATEKLLAGRTSFMIAHRLSTIRQADIILVVKDGKIVEQGTHESLLTAGGYYHSLYMKQFEEEKTALALKKA